MEENNNREYSSQGGYQNSYSYNNTYGQTYGQTGSTQGSYGTYGAGGQNGGSGNTYQSSGSNNGKKKGGFFGKLVKCVALALVFGLVAGAAFEGVQIAGDKITGRTQTANETSASSDTASGSSSSNSVLNQNTDSKNAVSTTSTSSNYVATDVSDIVAEVMPSIVSITNISLTEYQSFWGGQTQTYQSESAGSGIIVSQDSNNIYIATNNHVVDGATSLTVTFSDDSTVSAQIQGTYSSTDLAVIRVDISSIEADTLSTIKVATLGDSDALKVGEASIAIGNALGYGQSVTTGCISALNREVSVTDSSTNTSYTAELIQTDAAINPGNSGGALLNAKGEVIGINSVKYASTSVEGIGYAIPINTALPIITNIITKQSSSSGESAYLGIGGVDVTSSVAQSYNMPEGVYVRKIFAGTAAETAGIKEGDIITKIDGTNVSTSSELNEILEYYSAGDVVDIVVERVENGVYVEKTITVTLGKKQ
jgi:serine protease Do